MDVEISTRGDHFQVAALGVAPHALLGSKT